MSTTTPSPKQMSASEQITEEVTSWPGVKAGTGNRGEFGFTLGKHQLGHLHGDRTAHFGFPKDVWTEFFGAGGSASPPVPAGRPGRGSRRIENEGDVRDVIAMIRLN